MTGPGTLALRALAAWLLLMAAETVHGIVRTLFLAPAIGEVAARRWGVLIGTLIVFAITLVTIRWLNARRTGELLGVGLLWVALTVAFEVLVGRLFLHLDWSRIAADYDVLHGGLMPLGLGAMALAPWTAAWVSRR